MVAGCRRIAAFVRNSRTRDSRLLTLDVDDGSAHPFEQVYADGTYTLRVSPAMAAGVTTRLFEVMDLVNLLIDAESAKAA